MTPDMGVPSIWRCQCPDQCDDDESCWSDVTQEDFLCDYCRETCLSVADVLVTTT